MRKLLIALVLSLVGCATAPTSSDNQAIQVVVEEAAKATVRHYFVDHPGSAERIARFREIAKALINTEAVTTVGQLEQVALAEVAKTSDPVQRDDAIGLVRSLAILLRQYTGVGLLDANAVVRVKGVIAALVSALPA